MDVPASVVEVSAYPFPNSHRLCLDATRGAVAESSRGDRGDGHSRSCPMWQGLRFKMRLSALPQRRHQHATNACC